MLAIAGAEPPPYVPLDVATNTADQIVIATPMRVEFQELADSASMKRTTVDNFWVQYRVDKVLKGDLKPGQTVRAVSEVVGCEVSDIEIRREGDRFIEREVHGGHERDLDPTAWLEPHDGPTQMLFLAAGTPLRRLHVTDRVGTTPTHVEAVAALVARGR